MNVEKAILQRRSIRRFQPKPIPDEQLLKLCDLGRLYASGGNLQKIRYVIVSREPMKSRLYALLRWAAYLPDFRIAEDQHPAAYIILVGKAGEKTDFDAGAAATTVMLAAEELGLASCCLGAIDRPAIASLLNLPETDSALYVLALGYADERSTEAPYSGSVRYFEDEAGVLHVPKHSLSEVLIQTDTE